MSKVFDAILVLGIDQRFEHYKYRVRKAASLYCQGLAERVIFSGRCWGRLKPKPKQTEAGLMKRYAIQLGVPSSAIITEKRSLNTIGNFYFTRKLILNKLTVRKLLIVTHRNHFAKAKFLSKKILGPRYICKFVEDNPKVSKLVKEHTTLKEFKRLFAGLSSINDGDLIAIRELLWETSFYKNYREI